MRKMMVAALASLALLTAGCGGTDSGGQGVANVGGSTSATAQGGSGDGDALKYAQCMRENGLPDFPDPKDGGGGILGEGSGIDPESQEFKDAEAKCKQYLPNSGQPGQGDDPWSAEDKLAYAKCMRENGVPKFADPGADGNFPPIIKGGDVDPESPEFQKAEKICSQYQPEDMPNRAPGGGS